MKKLAFIFTASLAAVMFTGCDLPHGPESSLKDQVREKAAGILPPAELSTLESAMNGASAEDISELDRSIDAYLKSYRAYRDQAERKPAENPESNAQGRAPGGRVTDDDIKETKEMHSGVFGNLDLDGPRKAFLNAGMGIGREILGSGAGTLSFVVGAGVTAAVEAGTGIGEAYDFLNFTRYRYETSFVGGSMGVSFGTATSIGPGVEVSALVSESWLFGNTENQAYDRSVSVGTGHTVGVSGALGAGLGLSGSVSVSEEIDTDWSILDLPDLPEGEPTGAWGFSYLVKATLSAGVEEGLLVNLCEDGCYTVNIPGTDIKRYRSGGGNSSRVKIICAGFKMAADMLWADILKNAGIPIMTPFGLPGAVTAILYGFLYDEDLIDDSPGTRVATPVFSPQPGTFSGAQTVGIATATSGASIRYTVDGSDPGAHSGTLYSGPFTVSSTTTVKAVACMTAQRSSEIAAATYTIVPPVRTGTISGTVRDAVTDSGLGGVSVRVYSGTAAAASTTSGSTGSYSVAVQEGGSYRIAFSRTGYIGTEYSNIAVTPNVATHLETVLQVSTDYAGSGTVSGTITNALNGEGVPGAVIGLRSGIGIRTGTILYSATTSSTGSYVLDGVPGGNYTAQVSLAGYTTSYFTIVAIGGRTRENQNSSITPELPASQVRFVLTWGATPSDLDSHMSVPGAGIYSHVFYGERGRSESSPFALLDTDDTTGYGPETITIMTRQNGDYYYYVHDYSNRGFTTSSSLGNSGAQVRIYIGTTLAATFNVPVQNGTLWKVCGVNGTHITPINAMMYESSSSNVTARGNPDGRDSMPTGEERLMFETLPPKQ